MLVCVCEVRLRFDGMCCEHGVLHYSTVCVNCNNVEQAVAEYATAGVVSGM